MVGQLSSSFVSSLRRGDVFLLGGSTYRVSSIIGTRVNVTSATGYRPTIPSWTGEANSRSIELSQEVLELLTTVSGVQKVAGDLPTFLQEHYGLGKLVSGALAQFLDEHAASTFQVPARRTILIEEIQGPLPTYVVTTCRGRGFNLALGYMFAGMADRAGSYTHLTLPTT